MANPFLMDDDLGAGGDEDHVNPFLIQAEDEATELENPFAEDNGNPFAIGNDAANIDGAGKRQSTEFDAVMSFFGTTIEAEDDTLSLRSTAESDDVILPSKKESPPRPLPPRPKDLISTVSNQMEETSSDLLGRIPVTRSPSPVSIRDLHSPSPTQDNGVADLLDITDDNTTVDHPKGMDIDLLKGVPNGNDNPFDLTSKISSEMQGDTPMPSPPKPQPPRPPPARPAPPRPSLPDAMASVHSVPQRPPPPSKPIINSSSSNNSSNSTAPVPNTSSNADDLFDMFSPVKPPKPPPPKTKEEILGLFETSGTTTNNNVKPDLLSDDIVLQPTEELLTETKLIAESEEPVFNSVLTRPDESTHNITTEPPAAVQSEGHINLNVSEPEQRQRVPTPDIEITTVEDLPRSDDEEEDEEAARADEATVAEEEVTAVPTTVTENSDLSQRSVGEMDGEEDATDVPQMGLDHSSPPTEQITAVEEDEEVVDQTTPFALSEMDIDATPFNIPSGGGGGGGGSANPFASPDEEETTYPTSTVTNIFAADDGLETKMAPSNIFAAEHTEHTSAVEAPVTSNNIFAATDEFDAFAAKFESVKKDNISILDGFQDSRSATPTVDAWGDSAFGVATSTGVDTTDGFGNEDDDFYAMKAPVRSDSVESVEKDFSVVIRPKGQQESVMAPQLSPPPAVRTAGVGQYSNEVPPSSLVNPFDDSGFPAPPGGETSPSVKRTDSQESPQTPLFDEDVSQPLEKFPRLEYMGPGWEMQLRQPNKKKITGQRFWKKIFVRLVIQNDVPVVQLLNQANDKQPFQELPLQPSYSVSEIGAQQYDQFGKIFTMKLQYIFYKERPGVRPGQVTKAERITNKLTKFAQYAIAGDYEGVKEFGSDLKKLGLPVEHASQSTQLFKIGSMNYEDMKQFSICIEEALFRLPAPRDRALFYKMEEVQVTAVDEIVVEQDAEGKILKQIARVRLFLLAFLSGMPGIELGLNDMWRQGKEVVGRHDIIPVATEEWIRLEAVEFHHVVNQEEYEKTRTIKFQPPDANYIELLRFRVRPPKNRELPLQLKATWVVMGNKVELRADILVPGFTSRKLGQIPCEDVSVRFPIPECWIYLFRVEKHFRYGSVKSAHRRTGKIKGIERILGTVDTLQESLIEVTSGQAKYEHHHRAIVWRCPRLPKEGQGAYTTHQMVCRMALTSYDQIPSELAPYALVEFTMPATQVSHTTVRSVSIQDSDSDEPPEKYVRYLARHEYKVGIETTHGVAANAYLAATKPIREEPVASAKPTPSPVPPSDSDTDSN